MTEAQATTEAVAEQPKELTKEEQLVELRKLANLKHKSYSQLTGIHIDNLLATIISTNGVSYSKKLQAAQALKEGLLFAFDYGLNVSKAKIRQPGQAFAQESNNLAAIVAQLLDNRMLIIADKMNEEASQNNNNVDSTTESNVTTETGEQSNVVMEK